ncbi:MAG: 3-deoxy-8-phosphooctulonate synthase [Planctomycetaceae bacterium]|jgi:2-dehydro-3-deoxyphosphooctonate aldolase (KDO 8-P synthase)|nr:3-deoxy-8-phosphooctulonate synthase [Planctomycetaceae bacterium]
MTNNPVNIGLIRCGIGERFLLIAGPCALQEEFNFAIAEELVRLRDVYRINVIFKGSFDKANRTSIDSYRGSGLESGVRMLAEVRDKFGLSVTTDIHESYQAAVVGEVCDLIQIPAFLSRQTDLLVAAARTGRAVNVKKGQFMSPDDMKNVVLKLNKSGCENVLLCERGTFFGYGRLVNDMGALVTMRKFGTPIVFDATHSVQEPGGLGKTTGGNRELVEPLALAATAVGIDALFLETHPIPQKSPSDSANMIPLKQLESLIKNVIEINHIVKKK